VLPVRITAIMALRFALLSLAATNATANLAINVRREYASIRTNVTRRAQITRRYRAHPPVANA
jgi:hypothetical protein